MEKESSLLSFFSWFSSNQTPKESKLISDLRANKNEFEDKLRNKEVKRLLENEEYMSIFPFSAYNMTSTPIKFLQYCYYLKFHENMFNMRLDDIDIPSLKKCREARLNGYSALGAAIISDDTSIQEKRNFIKTLMIKYDFKPTLKDISLAELYLYDNISAEHKKIFIHLLHTHASTDWSVLPQEVRKHIAQYMIQLFKNEYSSKI